MYITIDVRTLIIINIICMKYNQDYMYRKVLKLLELNKTYRNNLNEF